MKQRLKQADAVSRRFSAFPMGWQVKAFFVAVSRQQNRLRESHLISEAVLGVIWA
ncbi:hypothetical protein [Rhizobium sp. Rhizsp42]|uniref:hypothetical protein n=1 Tax=Rhizobium sp. Rhizsp42 TaxID=3243034 RepID=UPI0039AF064F